MLSFKDFIVADYKPGEPELIKYAAHKRRRGRIGEDVDEALDFQQRRARSRAMKKNKAKIAMGRRRAAKRTAGQDRLKQRAKRSAIKQLFTKFAKGKSKEEIPYARRQEIEKRIQKMSGKVDKIARKLLPDIRKREKVRRSGTQGAEK